MINGDTLVISRAQEPTGAGGEHEHGDTLVTSMVQQPTGTEGEHYEWRHFGDFGNA